MIAIVITLAAMAIITVIVTVVGLVVDGGIRRWMPGGHEINVVINADADFLLRFPFGLLRIASSPPERFDICWRRYKPHHQLSLLRRCGHVFHTRCILPWLAANQNCPLCRRDVDGDDDDTSTTETRPTHAHHTSNNDSTAATHGSLTDRMALSSSVVSSIDQPSTDAAASTESSSTELASSAASCATPAPPRENETVSEVVPVQEGEGERNRSNPEEMGASGSEEVGCSCSPCCCFGLMSTIGQKKLRAGPRECESDESTHVMGCVSRCLRSIYKPKYKFKAHGGSTTHQPDKARAVIRFFSPCFKCIRPKEKKSSSWKLF